MIYSLWRGAAKGSPQRLPDSRTSVRCQHQVREQHSPLKMASDDPLEDMAKSSLNCAEAQALAERIFGVKGGKCSQLDGYDDQNFRLQSTEVYGNVHMEVICPTGYVLKVMNGMDSMDTDLVDAQNQLMSFLVSRGIKCPKPARTKDGRTFVLEQLIKDGPYHAIRLLEFVPGEVLSRVPWQPRYSLQVGRLAARIDSVMEEVSLSALETRETEWHLRRAPDVLRYLDLVVDESRKELIREVLKSFSRLLAEHEAELEDDTALIHGDINEHNIVMRQRVDGHWEVDGVLDLGDCQRAPRIFELAMAACYMAIQSGDPSAIGDVLAGYCDVKQVAGMSLLRVCICSRLCQSLVMGLRAIGKDPLNSYALSSQKNGWRLLQEIWSAPDGALEDQWTRHLDRHRLSSGLPPLRTPS